MSADLAATMGLDISDFTRSIDRAVDRLDDMSAEATASLKRIEQSVAPAANAMKAISKSSDPVTESINQQSEAIEKNKRAWMGLSHQSVNTPKATEHAIKNGDSAKPAVHSADSPMSSLSASSDSVTAAINQQDAAIAKSNRTFSQMADGGIKGVRAGLQDIGDASRKTGKALSWAGFASSAVAKLGLVGGTAGVVAKTLGQILRVTGKEMKTYGFYAQVLGKNYDDTSKSTAKVAEAQDNVKKSTKGLGDSVLSLAGNLSTTAVLGALVWKAGLDEVVEASGKWLSRDSAMMKAVTGTASAFSDAVQNGINMFSEGVEGSVLAIFKFATGFDTITEAVDAGGSVLTSWAKYAEESMVTVGKSVKEAGLVFGAALAIFQSGGNVDAGAFIEEGRQLNELAEKTAETMAKMTAVKSVYAMINDAAGKAASDAKTKNELSRIATLQSVEAIDQEIAAMKMAAQAMDKKALSDKNWRKEQEAKASALGKRKQDLESGGVPTGSADTAKAIADAQKKLDEMTLGENEVAIATAKANGASQDQIDKLTTLQEKIKEATDAKEASKKTEDANKKAVEQLNELSDKYDELTGSVTKAEAARQKLIDAGVDSGIADDIQDMMEQIKAIEEEAKEAEQNDKNREKFAEQTATLHDSVDEAKGDKTKGQVAEAKAIREGATEEEAAEIGRLTDEKESTSQKDKKDSSSSKGSDNQAVLAGTSEAAKIAFGGTSKMESLQEKQIKATTDVVKAINEKKDDSSPGKDID